MDGWYWHYLLWIIIGGIAVVAILVQLARYFRNLKNGQSVTAANKIQRIIAGILSLVIPSFMIWFLYTGNQDEIRRQQEIAARPHTVRILGYQITFPTKIPPGYDDGTISTDYSNDWEDDKQGKEGRTRFAKWWIYNGSEENQGGIEFMVNELASPGCQPGDWLEPFEWEKTVRVKTDEKEVAGLPFAVSHVQGEVYGPGDRADAEEKSEKQSGNRENYKQFLPAHGIPVSGIEYLAKDNGKIRGIRGYGCKGKEAVIALTESVLHTFQKFKSSLQSLPKGKDITARQPDGSMVIGHGGDYDDLKDPAVQWFK